LTQRFDAREAPTPEAYESPRNAAICGRIVALADGVGEGCTDGRVVMGLPVGTAAYTGGDGVWSSVKATRISVSGAMMMRTIPEGPTRRAAFPVRLRVLTVRTIRGALVRRT
jgi:hypothetical protein